MINTNVDEAPRDGRRILVKSEVWHWSNHSKTNGGFGAWELTGYEWFEAWFGVPPQSHGKRESEWQVWCGSYYITSTASPKIVAWAPHPEHDELYKGTKYA